MLRQPITELKFVFGGQRERTHNTTTASTSDKQQRIAIDFRLTERWTAGLNWTWSRKHRSWELTADSWSWVSSVSDSELREESPRFQMIAVQCSVIGRWDVVLGSAFHIPFFHWSFVQVPGSKLSPLLHHHTLWYYASFCHAQARCYGNPPTFIFYFIQQCRNFPIQLLLSFYLLLSCWAWAYFIVELQLVLSICTVSCCSGPVWRLRAFDRGQTLNSIRPML